MKKVIKNKKGLSDVVTTLIIILLVIVAVGIVWVVVKGTLDKSIGGIKSGTKCLGNTVQATRLTNDSTGFIYEVILSRESGSDEIAGVNIVFTNATGESNAIYKEVGNIAPFETKKVTGIETDLLNVNKVEVFVYFIDDSGNEQLCENADVKEF